MNSALLVYDACGNPYQMTTAYHPSNLLPAVVPFDNPIYEMIPHRIFVGGFPATVHLFDCFCSYIATIRNFHLNLTTINNLV